MLAAVEEFLRDFKFRRAQDNPGLFLRSAWACGSSHPAAQPEMATSRDFDGDHGNAPIGGLAADLLFQKLFGVLAVGTAGFVSGEEPDHFRATMSAPTRR